MLIELGGAVAGMLSEYAHKRGWSIKVIFFTSFSIFFAIAFAASFIYKTEVGLVMEVFYSFLLGLFMALAFSILFWWRQKSNF